MTPIVIVLAILLVLVLITLRAGRRGALNQPAVWGLIALYGTVAALIATRLPVQRHNSPAQVEVAALSAGEPVDVDATAYDEGEGGVAKDTATAEVLDVSLRNTGTEPALITRASLEILDVLELDDCMEGGGPVSVSGVYDLPIPSPLPEVPFHVERQLRFAIEPSTIERLAFTVGPESFYEGEHPTLYRVRLSLNGAGLPAPLLAEDAVIVAMRLQVAEDLFVRSWVDEDLEDSNLRETDNCISRNADAVVAFSRMSQVQSPQFMELLRFAQSS